ncbi:MAG TPA: regulatory protein RecX [Lachnospiraceae bacterium]|nr:regulatory protein RecX [Lachnospiraceae bacterium]
MIITELVETSKSRIKVYMDQEFAFVLYKGELRKYGIKLGQEIDEKIFDEIMNEVLPKRAKLRCLNLLKYKDYTREQLRLKLKQGGYPDQVSELALDYVASFRYIDDSRYAMDYIQCSQSSRSKRRIENDLRKRGVSPDVICNAWEQWNEEGNSIDEDEQIRQLLDKKHFVKEQADQNRLRRMYGLLVRKGFDTDKISKALLK